MADDDFFTAPPSEDAGFTLLGDETPADHNNTAAAFVGDVQDGDMGFAAPVEEDVGFASAPVEESAPIILGAPPVEEQEEEAPAPVVVQEEASAMKKFNAEWQETLASRKAEEDAAKESMVEAAKLALEKFQADASAKRDAKMATNREDEQAKLEAIEADLENDNSWQRVNKMVDLTQDDGAAASTKRMKDIFIQLKNEPGLAAKVGA